jgi:uncharacterized protein YjbJ (UPF0337 family)
MGNKIKRKSKIFIQGVKMDLSMMLKSQWNQLRGKAKEKWGKLTDDDLDTVQGQFDQLVGIVQEKYELTRTKAEAEVNEFLTGKNEEEE